ncbi:FAD-dependent oxidoreductase [Cyclobacterium sp.]|uniref:FAD-dependent oxidoreductase n=1 Tax=Cyclobacterium sp. TaxID=1966343 RepID=UPI00198376CD|nr:FAD-dependent oxidoreductase [Cyclobacterium sp.]MBD3629465.1 FAD-dependent oxidoreductase [Cyclobacterium sp.]
MKSLLLALCFLFSVLAFHPALGQNQSYDIVIYGGTSAGVAAAIQSSRMGKSVILIEPSNHVGGLTTGGLGATDIGNKQAIGGISREFYQGIKSYYDNPDNWTWQDRSDYFTRPDQGRSKEGEDAMWTFEPSAAKAVYEQMMAAEDIRLVTGKRLDRANGVESQNNRITAITMESGETYKGKMFMDATYEGDLLAAAGVSYMVGREANSEFGETLNGVQANYYNRTLKNNVSRNAIHHNFIPGVDPYVEEGNPSSGLLPFIIEGGPGIDGTADDKLQAYCFRMTLTDHPDNRIPFEKPDNYKEIEYELLFRNYEAATGPLEEMYHYGDPLVPWINTPMPNRKTDTNNQKGFSTDFVGQNHNFPEASYEEREAIAQRHLEYQQGLMWTLAYHPRIPQKVRDVVSKWGMAKDEFEEREGWTPQLYIREARRMRSDYVVTQRDCEGLEPPVADVVGLAAYGMDSHMVQRFVDHNGYVQNEGNFEAHVPDPYPIPYRAIVPKKGESANLLVPVCVSSTHVAFGSIRMEPVFMVLGQSAATAASLAIDQNVAVQDLDYQLLAAKLKEDQQILEHK